jgi:thioredoxin reductase (NADPH)
MNYTDLLIVGAGPIGISCALAAQKAGLSYRVIEKGCLTNSLFNYPLDMQFFSSSEKLELEQIPFVSTSVKPSRTEALEYYRRVASAHKLHIQLYERVNQIIPSDTNFKVITDLNTYSAKSVVLATGFFDIPENLGVPGESLSKVTHYFHQAHPYSMQKVAVVGASNSAIDAALACYRKGAEVTLIVRGPEIGKRVKYWVRPDIINRIEEGSIKAHFNTQIKAIHPKSIELIQGERTWQEDNEYVIAMTGYRPDLDFLSNLGIPLEGVMKKPVHDSATMMTPIKGLYLAGVICGGLETHKWFIENSRTHGKQIVTHILENNQA